MNEEQKIIKALNGQIHKNY